VQPRTAIVTGAAQGIGQAYADALAADGYQVAYADLKAEQAQANAEQARGRGAAAIGVACDVAAADSVAAMVDAVVAEFGGVDVLVNNAALYEGYSRYNFMEIPLDYWQRFLDVNLTSALICARAVYPSMVERGGGKIINQSSGASTTSYNHYGLTKLALQGLTVGLARELGSQQICVNAIAPGVIANKSTIDLFGMEDLEGRRKNTALQRLGQPSDLTSLLVFLASAQSDWITGQIFYVNGGTYMSPL
jgi:3-oxoacyl-[acyl-carrier protein] reductase